MLLLRYLPLGKGSLAAPRDSIRSPSGRDEAEPGLGFRAAPSANNIVAASARGARSGEHASHSLGTSATSERYPKLSWVLMEMSWKDGPASRHPLRTVEADDEGLFWVEGVSQ